MSTSEPRTNWQVGSGYRTMNGYEARIYATDGGGSFPLHGAVWLSPDEWLTITWNQQGIFYPNSQNPNAHELDLDPNSGP